MLPPPDPQLQMAVAPFLLPNERLYWAGRPARGILFQWMDVFLVPFSFAWASLPYSMLFGGGLFRNMPTEFDLFGAIFLIAGAYITVGRFLHDMLVRARTTYAVTDQRVIQLRHFFSPSIRSQDIHSLNAFDLHESRSGRGTIAFDYDGDWWSRGGMRWSPAIGRGLRFVAITQVRDVYALIQSLV